MTEPENTEPLSEYERTPVPERAWKGHSSFWGMYAGEHTAGTEFMIGPLFVKWGADATGLIFGLLLGNLLAVLTWRFLTAPIATQQRLTLYYKMEKIAGANLVKIYNLANGLLFCFLAGSMVTVSATAVGPFFPPGSIVMPTFEDRLPTGMAWIISCVVLGGLMTLVAMKGYEFVARVGHWAAPWMFLIFVSCALVTLGRLKTWNVWELLTPSNDAQTKISFLAIVFFAWFCNAAMHLGMADLSILRFARSPRCGWASAAGMFLGHYLAWICAALLLVYWVRVHKVDPQVGKDPGTMVNDAVGWAGLICIIIAGWTTANPTIYRAGLALQGIVPGMSRSTGTIIAGVLSTVAGIFPAFAMNLLAFVGIYGTILAPIGSIIVVDHYWGKKMRLPQDRATARGSQFDWAVLLAWLIPVGTGIAYLFQNPNFFPSFLPLPCALATGALYILFCKLFSEPGRALAGGAP